MLKFLTIAANSTQLLLLTYLLIADSYGKPPDVFIFAVFFAAPISTMAWVYSRNDKTLLGLYLERRRLEELKKVQALQD